MTSPALSLAEIDASWDEEPSGIRARPQRKPPLPLHVVALRLVRAEAVSARVNAAGEVVGSSGVRVTRRKASR